MTGIEFHTERISLLESELKFKDLAKVEGDYAEWLWHDDQVTAFEHAIVLAGVFHTVYRGFQLARYSLERKYGYDLIYY